MSQRAAPDADFAHGFRLGDETVAVQQQNLRIIAGVADGNGLGVLKFPLNFIVGAVAGSLGGAVEVGKLHLGHGSAPQIELLGGHDFP